MIPISGQNVVNTVAPSNTETATAEAPAPADMPVVYNANTNTSPVDQVIVVDGDVNILYGENTDTEDTSEIINIEPMFKSDEPVEDSEAPAEESEAPAEEHEAPVEESEAPVEESEAPAEEPEAPAEESEAPAEEPEAPAEESEAPAEEPEAPAEEFIHTDAIHADELLTDEEAEERIEYIDAPSARKNGKVAAINLDTLCDNFDDGETVTIENLKAKKLVPSNVERIKILARGVMTKRLDIIADKFSLQAVKMITLAGGRAEQQR